MVKRGRTQIALEPCKLVFSECTALSWVAHILATKGAAALPSQRGTPARLLAISIWTSWIIPNIILSPTRFGTSPITWVTTIIVARRNTRWLTSLLPIPVGRWCELFMPWDWDLGRLEDEYWCLGWRSILVGPLALVVILLSIGWVWKGLGCFCTGKNSYMAQLCWPGWVAWMGIGILGPLDRFYQKKMTYFCGPDSGQQDKGSLHEKKT